MRKIKEIIEDIVESKKEHGGIKEVYYVACGGSLGASDSKNIFAG